MSRRKAKVKRICLQNVTFNVDIIWIDDHLNIAYCPVAKVGSTYWKRLLLFLNNETFGLKIKKPVDIPRHYVHYVKPERTKVLKFQNATFSSNMKRFMFVRDPYSRLWSTYIDKFFLPDFWRTYARFAMRLRRQKTPHAIKCRNDVTFEEFLQYVARFRYRPMKMNEHWRPLVFICDPCKFHPDIIGKQETFVEDSKFIMKLIGKEHLASYDDFQERSINEISTLIDYNFDFLKKPFYMRCISHEEMAVRLWRAFQFNGYLPLDVDFHNVSSDVSVMDANTFKSLVIRTLIRRKSSVDSWRSERRSVMVKAYRKVKRKVLEQIVDLFKWDFRLFGYNQRPKDIFGHV